MICIPIIAGEGGSDNAKKLEKGLAGRCLTMRGAGAPLHSPSGGLRPPQPPWVGLPGPHLGFLSFHDERNQRRAGAAPLDPRWGALSSPQQRGCAAPPRKGLCRCPRPICHFEIVSKSGSSSPQDWQRSHLLLSNRGAAGRTGGSCWPHIAGGRLEIGVAG